jgi:type IV secretion system protein TrbF
VTSEEILVSTVVDSRTEQQSSAEGDAGLSAPRKLAENRYLSARREWDERYGDLIKRARNWRIAALLAMVTALIATGGIVALSVQTRIVPFVVAVDSLGRPVATGLADQASIADDRLKRAMLIQWVSDLRTVTSDGIAQRKSIDRVYAAIARGSAAQLEVSDFYRKDPPQKRAQLVMVSVDVKAIYASSERTYEVEWVETTRGLGGDVQSEQAWKGSFTIAVNPPSDEQLARVNPLGLYVVNASWSKVL